MLAIIHRQSPLHKLMEFGTPKKGTSADGQRAIE